MNAELKSRIEAVMGPLPGNAFDRADFFKTGDGCDCGDHERIPVRITTPSRTVVTAWWLKPKRPRGTGVIALHPTIDRGKDDVVGLSGRENRSYGRELAARGHTVLAPDYPGFGECREDFRAFNFASASMMGIVNHISAVTVLLSLEGVSNPHAGCIGHSLGGHNAIFLSAFDARVAAAVSSCGLSTFSSYRGGDLSAWATLHYMPRIASEFQCDPARVPFDFPELLAAILPRAVCVIAPTSDTCFDCDGARECVAAARRAGAELGLDPDRVIAFHPECGHDFPPDARRISYAFLESQLDIL